MVFAFIALLIALCFAYILMPYFCSFSGKDIPFDLKGNFMLAAVFVAITAVSGFLSGIYPALFLSGLKPLKILKGFSGSEKGSGHLRRILVVVQSVIAVSLIICTVIVFRQLVFLQNRDLGFNKEHFIYIPLYGDLKEKYELIKTEISKNPDVIASCFSSSIMSKGAYCQDQLRWEGRVYENEKFMSSRMAFISVDKDFIEAFEMDMVKGTSFAKDPPKKMNEEAIINETAAKMIGIEPIVGLPVKIPGGFNGKIIGVVKDYNYMPLQNQIGPIVISIEPPFFRFLMIKIKYDNMNSTLDYIRNVLRSVEPNFPFEFRFLDDAFDAVYSSDMLMRNLVELFTVIAIFIACLGMFGLSSFSADRRRKEVGVRKILGASIPDIIRLLSSEYLVLITIANIFAWPIAYYFMNKWLQNYAYRINIGVETFIFAILISLFITVFTVIYKSFKAARANPVDSLRRE
jgi:ABC-type antimicrobial peptide transport system permease subunit